MLMKKTLSNIEKKIFNFSNQFEETLIKLIPKTSHFSNRLDQAMKYVISVGGKRLRPLLVYGS